MFVGWINKKNLKQDPTLYTYYELNYEKKQNKQTTITKQHRKNLEWKPVNMLTEIACEH